MPPAHVILVKGKDKLDRMLYDTYGLTCEVKIISPDTFIFVHRGIDPDWALASLFRDSLGVKRTYLSQFPKIRRKGSRRLLNRKTLKTRECLVLA